MNTTCICKTVLCYHYCTAVHAHKLCSYRVHLQFNWDEAGILFYHNVIHIPPGSPWKKLSDSNKWEHHHDHDHEISEVIILMFI